MSEECFMTSWPGKEAFKEGWPDLTENPRAQKAMALRMRDALANEDLATLSSLCSKWPILLFHDYAANHSEPEQAIEELWSKTQCFSFDAGLAWASAAGERVNDVETLATLKTFLSSRIGFGLDARRPALAFACGALQAPLLSSSLSEWLWDQGIGSNGYWLQREFGAAELSIWGERWKQEAELSNTLPRWCAIVLGQALARSMEGSAGEMSSMLDYAKGLGEPLNEWLSSALYKMEPFLLQQAERLGKRLERSTGIAEANRLSVEQMALWSQRLQAQGASLCLMGPESWGRTALSPSASPEMRSLVERVQLATATTSGAPISKGSGAPRI